MEISALTRSVVKQKYALISTDGYIGSKVPGWDNCVVNVIINEQMGAGFCQCLITAQKDCVIKGRTIESQLVFYVVDGETQVTVGNDSRALKKGQFVYVPITQNYLLDTITAGTQILTFHKIYEHLEGFAIPETIFGDAANIDGFTVMGDEWLVIQELLPADLRFDMAINIFTLQPGANFPLVETHIMEHGLLFLQGQGIYLLGQDWYPVKKGDSIWMAPYCQQWFTAMGKEPAVYIYYKNINRFPTVI